MSNSTVVFTIDKPHFTVKLHEDLLEVDLKEGLRKEFEDLAEARPILRETIGMLYQLAGPLDVPLKDIEKVIAGEDGKVKVVIPQRRDLHVTLTPAEAESLKKKLDELIPVARQKAAELERIAAETRAKYEAQTSSYEGEARRPVTR